jgi:tRNA dimethylallyltransferase
MDIGTAKPSAAQRAAVPHHLIDIRNPDEEFSVADYLAAAEEAIAAIRQRRREVLFVGGTPLYLKSLLRGLCEGPEADWEFRRAVEAEARALGPEALHERVRQVDPLAASQLHPHDTRRLIRALEVYTRTGQPISHRQLQFEEGRPAEACRVFVLRRGREALRERIEQRVQQMFDAGLEAEVRRLTEGGATLGRTARQAVGYRETIDMLAGRLTRVEAIQRTKARTRRFAKRQGTWFRSLSECRFLDVSTGEPPATTAEQILAAAGST